MARIRSIKINAITSNPNTRNITTPIIPWFIKLNTDFTPSVHVFISFTSENLKTQYQYIRSALYIHALSHSIWLGERHVLSVHFTLSIFFLILLYSLLYSIVFGIIFLSHQLISPCVDFCVLMYFWSASAGIFNTDAVTILDSEMINWMNHHVSGTRRIPSASFGRSCL